MLYAIFYLTCHAFLYLQAMGKDVYDPRYLAQTGNITIGDVGHVGLAIERQDMMLAKREEIDVLYNDHLRIVLTKFRRIEHLFRIHIIAARQL